MASVTGNVSVQNQPATATSINAALDRQGALMVSEMNGRFSQLSRAGMLYGAQAIVTAPVIYSTAAGTGGPLLWNPPGSGVVISLVAAAWGETTASAAAAALGITGGTGQNIAPTATTAIDGSTNLNFGQKGSNVTAYRIGTPVAAGAFLLPFGNLGTGALTTTEGGFNFQYLEGLITVPPGAWCSIAASATATTSVITAGLYWAELPV